MPLARSRQVLGDIGNRDGAQHSSKSRGNMVKPQQQQQKQQAPAKGGQNGKVISPGMKRKSRSDDVEESPGATENPTNPQSTRLLPGEKRVKRGVAPPSRLCFRKKRGGKAEKASQAVVPLRHSVTHFHGELWMQRQEKAFVEWLNVYLKEQTPAVMRPVACSSKNTQLVNSFGWLHRQRERRRVRQVKYSSSIHDSDASTRSWSVLLCHQHSV